ncbi:MAG: LysR substrate-binding domain-containing protein [Gammaproteobacteria bacterium]|nr:LysR substrate-binding domain-containing protein [Gammaproteobacteria bacterium]
MLKPDKPAAPQLNALRAFEAAARLGGFRAAAHELSVTPGAIAQHVKALEAWAGAPLFERLSQGVRLTSLGARVAGDFSLAFDQLGHAINGLRAGAEPREIRIAVLPSIAQLWLSPRLPAVRASLAQTTISIIALDTPPNLLREPFDLSLFFVADETRGHNFDLCRDRIFPVCAPALANRLRDPADLRNCRFLHDTHFTDDWPDWLASAAPGLGLDTTGARFSLYSLALQEAQNGAGVLMGHEPLVRAALDDGSLVAPFAERVEVKRSLKLATPAPARAGTAVAVLIEYLRAAAGERSDSDKS